MKMKLARNVLIISTAVILLGLSACGRGQEDTDTYEPYGDDYTPHEPEDTGHYETGPEGDSTYEASPPSAYQPEPEIYDEYDYHIEHVTIDPPTMYGTEATVIVNGLPIHWAIPRIVGDGYFPTHVPLEAIADALGSHVNWNHAEGDIVMEGLNGTIVFHAGMSDFAVGGSLITLNQPSIVIDGVIYVPIAFFRDVYGMNNAMVYGGHVVIDNTEVMQ
ncbi:MAG: copper amine oxidase N-terminal domain-containing protein [Defluviitaleaceae bacterium]|nr:copper amine oxidase N-terminal domain-containing protein [Defluviitaleaceae bacterium]